MCVRFVRVFPALLLAAADAGALCPIHPYRFVGNTALDANCTDDTIQSAIDFAATGCANTTIAITHAYDFTAQALTINGTNGSLTLVGVGDAPCGNQGPICGPGGCGSGGGTPTTPQLMISASGQTSHSVVSISGTSYVTLQYLTISGARLGPGTHGGGIDFNGEGSLTLNTSSVVDNTAGNGGGIEMNGTGAGATLTLGPYSIIESNNAFGDGGGVDIEGNARLLAASPNGTIASNHAPNGRGGGIAIVGPARADLGSGGYEGLPAVYFNDAANGGGVAVTDIGSGEPVLRVFAKDNSHPTAIDSNTATTNGGGIFLSGHADTCLFALHMADNIAEDGAAIYYDAQLPGTTQIATDSGVYINGGSPSRLGADCGPELVSDLGGSKDCRAYDPLCNTFLANATQHADATPAPGGVVTTRGGEIVANRFRIRNSVAGYAMYVLGTGAVSVSRCELTDNLASTNLVLGSGQLPSFHSCTIANNSIGNLFVFDFGFAVSVELAYDIVDQPGKDTLYWGKHYGGSLSVDYVLTNSLAGLPQNNPSDIQGLPTFVDAANGDYHLAPSLQIAFDFGGNANTIDLDGNSPFADLPTIPNFLGPADLGAYERQNLFYDCGSRDSVFCDGFGH